ncbi:MAG: amidohydrolase [Spirochaetales bacterium]|nr:amidohydrolase [Spirochaetales bacterium]
MTLKELKQIVLKEIDSNRDRIISLAKSIFAEPEVGYKEYKTAEKVKQVFTEWGIKTKSGLALTGIRGTLKGARPGPCIGILSELDALINPEHPAADPETGAVHACGHFAQVGWMIGAGFGLRKVTDELCGKVVLFAVPAEEFINLEFRQKLKDKGKIKYFGGKQELARLGEFNDIDLMIMNHAQSELPGRKVFFTDGSNGFVGKYARFLGRAAHAGLAPDKGINALNAFNIALAAIHAQRETFKDEDMVRVHPIITKGGDSVNVVPSEVTSEMYVRARTTSAIKEVNGKVDRALKAGAMGVGARVEITTTAGYMPLINNDKLQKLMAQNAADLIGKENVLFRGAFGGSTDMGDLTHLKPGIHPMVGGFSGDLHSKDFKITDEEMAFIIPAKINALTVVDLLYGDGGKAKEIISKYKPLLNKKEYEQLLDSLNYKILWNPEEV